MITANYFSKSMAMSPLVSKNIGPILLSLGLLLSAVKPMVQAQDDVTVDPMPKLRLQYRTADQSILYVVGDGAAEVQPAQQTCDAMKLGFNSIPSLDTLPLDCSKVHAIILGSNAIDFFGGEEQSPHQLQVFSTLEKFVASGGHLLLFGSYNGRNSEHLVTFGIHTSFYHNDFFRPVPGRTDILFAGFENTVPAPALVRSMGNVTIDADRTSVTMLKRGTASESGQPGTDFEPDGPVLATLAYQRGRVSYCPVEPSAGGLWLVPIAVSWIGRGAPTNEDQLNSDVVVPKSLLRTKNTSITPAFKPSELKAVEQQLGQEYASEVAGLRTPEQERGFADALREKSKSEANPARKFSLTKMAWQHQFAGGDFTAAADILANAANQYNFDLIESRLELLPVLEQTNPTAGAVQTIELLLNWASEAEAVFHFVEAKRFADLAQQVATSASDSTLVQVVNDRIVALEPLVAAQQAVAADLTPAPGTKRDADAQSRLGRFIALSARDWELGLPLLAKGSNSQLGECAKLDLAAPDDPHRQMELAELWSRSDDDLTQLEHHGAQERARYWYLRALQSTKGAERTQITAALAALDLPRVELKIQMRVDGSGQLEISQEGVRWKDYYGTPVTQIHVNSQTWSAADAAVLINQGTTQFLQAGASLDHPQIRRLRGRGMVALQRNSTGVILVNINDVPGGSDDYEFIVDVVR